MKTVFHEFPEISDLHVFEYYAREQWQGTVIEAGMFLFDNRMFPDFAFEVVKADPKRSVISRSTIVLIESGSEETMVSIPKTHINFDDVVGQAEAKHKCGLIMRYLNEPERFGRWAPKNVLFHGPSGTGKTMLAKALANETEVPLLAVKATYLIGEHVGDGSRRIHHLYQRAADLAPCIIFIDELDAIALDRSFQELRGDVSEVVNALLTEMDGIEERMGVCTISATNRIDSLDTAIRSRFEAEIEFNVPDYEERLAILRQYASTFPVESEGDLHLEEIASKTDQLTGRDLVEKVLKTALHQAIIDNSLVTSRHIEEAAKNAVKRGPEPPKHMFA